MKKFLVVPAMLVILIGMFFAFRSSEKAEWTLDKPHGRLSFTVSHFMVSDVEGWFKDFDATITSEKEDFSDAVVTMTAKTNSINTENDMRDKDLKSEKYFDVDKYPSMTFKSKTFKKLDDQNYIVTGDLTLHGITKTVEMNALCKMGIHPMTKKAIAGFKVTGKINRLDFGVGASTPPAMIGNEVSIVANVQFDKTPLP